MSDILVSRGAKACPRSLASILNEFTTCGVIISSDLLGVDSSSGVKKSLRINLILR